jgi:hypothetical protein
VSYPRKSLPDRSAVLQLQMMVPCLRPASKSSGQLYNAVVLSKYDQRGAKVFSKTVAGAVASNAIGGKMSSDGAGFFYVTGHAAGSIDGKPVVGEKDGFVAKYDESGQRAWISTVGSPGAVVMILGIENDSAGNSYVTGSTTDNLEMPGKNTDAAMVFLAKFDTNGKRSWTTVLGSIDEAK